MSDDAATLSVSIKELPSVHVAYITYQANVEPGDMHNEIGECFRRVQAWVRKLGYDPLAQLTIGAIQMVEGRLSTYDCCVQVPEKVHSGSNGVDVKELPGGRCAVVSMTKDPNIIGPSIGHFYQHNLTMDGTRPTYEIYYASTMEYCVPIL